MKYRAGLSPPRKSNPKRKSEYSNKFSWKKPVESTPILAAEQVKSVIYLSCSVYVSINAQTRVVVRSNNSTCLSAMTRLASTSVGVEGFTRSSSENPPSNIFVSDVTIEDLSKSQ